MNKVVYIFALVGISALFFSCKSSAKTEETTKTEQAPVETPVTEAPVASEADIKAFLNSKEGTYGWQTTSSTNMLDFFADGRLHIQGPDGEATMWLGTWKIAGDKVTMVCQDIKLDETVSAKIDGEKLILGDKTYTRYKPQ